MTIKTYVAILGHITKLFYEKDFKFADIEVSFIKRFENFIENYISWSF